MTRTVFLIMPALLSFTLLVLPPANLPAHAMGADFNNGSSGIDNGYAADSAILSAGSRAAAVSKLRKVPSVGVVNLNFHYVPLLRNDDADPAVYKISAGRNIGGIKRLRAALAANSATRRALARHGVSIGRVVGVDIYSNGSIRVYII